jgi:phosphatidylserine/phosphatidylglycerophosphate/cardiolipin synthase-like enzyme
MPQKKSTSRSTSKPSSKTNRNLTLIITGGCLILAAYFLLTGADPLGLFGEASPSPAPVQVSEPGSGGEGDWWQVYFTDPNNINDPENLAGSIPEKLIYFIDNAKQTIHIAAFEFDLTPVAEALIAAHQRGVEVQWITDDEYGIAADEEDGRGQFAMLENAGIEVKDDGRGALMHNKFWIFDRQTVWTGSTNITVNGNFRNNNNVIVMRSTRLAEIFEREFSEMWDDGEFGTRSPSTVDQQSVTIDGTPVQVLFAAEDEVISKLIPLVEGAQKSIRIMAFSFTHDDLGAAVLARAQAGVDVKVIFETRGSETEYSELGNLYCAGVPARQDGNPGTFHHKVIIIDDETVVTGSLNFSDNADESNDENVVIVTNKDIAGLYLQEFERRWAEANVPDKASLGCK